MATRVGPIAEENPFLTGTNLVPATTLSGKLGLSPEARYRAHDDPVGEEIAADSQRSEVSSDDDELEFDGSVQEEMVKLEETFRENGLKFRMIDRIGEGDNSKRQENNWQANWLINIFRYFLDGLQSRRPPLRIL